MAADLTYKETIERLFDKTGSKIVPGLERTEALLETLGNPHRRYPSFHVAGTNGKGSTVATLDALLSFEGRRVGRYTSPHLVDFRERIQVAGNAIGEVQLLALLQRLDPVAESIGATFFEITTAAALAHFAESNVDVAVIETGLGGALDSTNVLDPVVATVTNISLDHTEYLGSTLAEIADEKGGIFKFGRPAVIAEPRVDLARRLAERAAERGATPILVTRHEWRAWSVSLAGGMTSFTAETPLGRTRLSTPLIGEHQVRNTLAALATLHAAGPAYAIRKEHINRALSTVRLPGRFQRIRDWVFDVAHNAAGARALAETLAARPSPAPVTVILGVLKDKDWYGIIDALAPISNSFIITQPLTAPPDRAWDPIKAAAHANACNVPVSLDPDFRTAIDRAASLPGTKVVCGSFHTVGDAMRILGVDPLTVPKHTSPGQPANG
ncbi:MAG: bifunctional folylpolyglutamate synthase/dihydrofolate synthase [Gemmatimonadota bacterium]|nr:bifunctional folylpolyglutamate synthase/dihydrofolate synthase [Gemmatimonadota bacterium]